VQLRFKAVTGAVRFPVMDKIQFLKWKIIYSTHQVLFLLVFFIVSYSFWEGKLLIHFSHSFLAGWVPGFWLHELMTDDPINSGRFLRRIVWRFGSVSSGLKCSWLFRHPLRSPKSWFEKIKNFTSQIG
jgi:hypothetical protein